MFIKSFDVIFKVVGSLFTLFEFIGFAFLCLGRQRIEAANSRQQRENKDVPEVRRSHRKGRQVFETLNVNFLTQNKFSREWLEINKNQKKRKEQREVCDDVLNEPVRLNKFKFTAIFIFWRQNLKPPLRSSQLKSGLGNHRIAIHSLESSLN